jgi:hypothetical protein
MVSHYNLCRDCYNKKQRDYYAENIAMGRTRKEKPTDKLYFVEEKNTGNIKIGRTSRPIEERMITLQTANSSALALLKCVPASPVEEVRLHARFRAAKVRGEWFRPTPELLAYIDGIQCEVAP